MDWICRSRNGNMDSTKPKNTARKGTEDKRRAEFTEAPYSA